jgi:hypothetical protein
MRQHRESNRAPSDGDRIGPAIDFHHFAVIFPSLSLSFPLFLSLFLPSPFFKEVAYYYGSSSNFTARKRFVDWYWVNGNIPKDTPVCGYDGSLCPQGLPEYAWFLISFFIIIAVFAVAFFVIYRRYKLEAELAAMSWRIRWEELSGERRRSLHEHRPQKGKSKGFRGLPETSNIDLMHRTESQISLPRVKMYICEHIYTYMHAEDTC